MNCHHGIDSVLSCIQLCFSSVLILSCNVYTVSSEFRRCCLFWLHSFRIDPAPQTLEVALGNLLFFNITVISPCFLIFLVAIPSEHFFKVIFKVSETIWFGLKKARTTRISMVYIIYPWFIHGLSMVYAWFSPPKMAIFRASPGLAEMTRLVVKKGGKASTITGLAGASHSRIWSITWDIVFKWFRTSMYIYIYTLLYYIMICIWYVYVNNVNHDIWSR